MYIFLSPIVKRLQSLLEVLLSFDQTGNILLIKLFPDFRAFVLVDILVAPEVKVVILSTLQLHLYRVC